VSRCRLLKVEGLTLAIQGLDAIDGTPVLDIKPYMTEFGPRELVRQPAWATGLMKEYFAGE
jgi:tRNA (Thr-GGU) A37 N-methylase